MAKVIKLHKKTIQRRPMDICLSIKNKTFNHETLTKLERDTCIEYLYTTQGLNQTEIADYLKITRMTVWSRIKALEARHALELSYKGIDAYKIAWHLIVTTQYVKSRAREKDDFRLYLDAEHRLKDALQDLGVVYKAPLQVQVDEHKKISIQFELIENERLSEVISILADAGIIKREEATLGN